MVENTSFQKEGPSILNQIILVLDIKYQSIIKLFQVTLNSSVNFVIYCIFGEKFKRWVAHYDFNYCWQNALRRGGGLGGVRCLHPKSWVPGVKNPPFFVAKYCRWDLCTFSSNFSELKNSLRQFFPLFGCMVRCLGQSKTKLFKGFPYCKYIEELLISEYALTSSCPY